MLQQQLLQFFWEKRKPFSVWVLHSTLNFVMYRYSKNQRAMGLSYCYTFSSWPIRMSMIFIFFTIISRISATFDSLHFNEFLFPAIIHIRMNNICKFFSLKVPAGQIWSAWEWYHCMYTSPWKGHQPLKFFLILISLFNIWKRLQSSELLHAKLNPTSCLFGSQFAQNSVFLLAGALLFDEKIPPKCCTIMDWSAGCWNSLLTSGNPKNNWCLSRIFWSRVRREQSRFEGMQTVCMKRIRTLNSYQIFNIKIKIKNL